jgi:ABC-type multidrug transport system ATPase subunit
MREKLLQSWEVQVRWNLYLGAGKTTLLNILAGRIGAGKLSGEILLSGKKRNKSNWAKKCAYVEQDDFLNPHLTVQETIDFAAQFRLPREMSSKEKDQTVNDIIMDLGLNHCRYSRIGDQDVRGVSGGERKRASIGQELITTPEVMFLDEPTSGLDAFTAFNIISTLKDIAVKRKKIVIMTIHQPRTDIMELIDKVLLLSAGKTVWLGSAKSALEHFHVEGYRIPLNTNPSDFFIDLITIDHRNDEARKISEERVNKLTASWEKRRLYQVVQANTDNGKDKENIQFSLPFYRQCLILVERDTLLQLRNRGPLVAKFIRTVAMIVINELI